MEIQKSVITMDVSSVCDATSEDWIQRCRDVEQFLMVCLYKLIVQNIEFIHIILSVLI